MSVNKGLLVFLLLVKCVCSARVPFPKKDTTNEAKSSLQFSPEAKHALKEASFQAISFLCFREHVLPEIENKICRKAFQYQFLGKSPPESYSACVDCNIADPICWDACPQ